MLKGKQFIRREKGGGKFWEVGSKGLSEP